jgi:DNA polymerase I
MISRRPGFRRDEEPVLAVEIAHTDRITALARQARQLSAYPIGDLACFNVDFSRESRYCLENGIDPTPASQLSKLRLSVPMTETSNDIYGELSVAGDAITGTPREILTAMQAALEAHDPDVLVCL